jgi:hypothetical protein
MRPNFYIYLPDLLGRYHEEYRMKFNFLKVISLGLVLSISGLANAGLISADFRTEADLPSGSSGPKVYENLGQNIGSGYELDGSNFIANPSFWGGGVVWMDFDPINNQLLLDSQDGSDFETFDAFFTNIVFDDPLEYISGIMLMAGELVVPTVTPQFLLSANSIQITYDAPAGNTFNFTNESARFQVLTTTTTVVPEPATFAIFALGLMGLASRRLMKKS